MFRSTPQTGQRPAQSSRQRIARGKRQRERVTCPGRQVEHPVLDIRRVELLARAGLRDLTGIDLVDRVGRLQATHAGALQGRA